jgi:dihydrofolate synthase/folylpolyglutamate synthase
MDIDGILSRYINNENKPGGFTNWSLDGIRSLLKTLGNPENSLRIIHVAGTNGKGSTCHYLSALCTAHGIKTGLFTSPHLVNVNERIAVDSKPIDDPAFLECLAEVDQSARLIDSPITYFDLLTATALLHFKKEQVGMVILETGLGGRLDSTNIVTPVAVVITPIDLDHTQMLGDSITSIAQEKAGIIKENTPVITSNSSSGILGVLSEKSNTLSAPLFRIGVHFFAEMIKETPDGISFSYRAQHLSIDDIKIPHPGFFQANNCATAIASLNIIGIPLDENTVRKSLQTATVPGRMEILSKSPLILFDPAHNRHAIRSLSHTLKRQYKGKKITVFTTFLKDKNPAENIGIIREEISPNIVYCTLDDPRAYHPDNHSIFKSVIPVDDITGITSMITDQSADIYIFTGSFRLYQCAKAAARLSVDIYSNRHRA